jgi:hypothetical protein
VVFSGRVTYRPGALFGLVTVPPLITSKSPGKALLMTVLRNRIYFIPLDRNASQAVWPYRLPTTAIKPASR